MRTIAMLLTAVMLFTGCATHYVRPDTTLEQGHVDYKESRQLGYSVSGGILTGLGVVLWPLLLVGIPLIVGAKVSEKNCMHEHGYSQEAG